MKNTINHTKRSPTAIIFDRWLYHALTTFIVAMSVWSLIWFLSNYVPRQVKLSGNDYIHSHLVEAASMCDIRRQLLAADKAYGGKRQSELLKATPNTAISELLMKINHNNSLFYLAIWGDGDPLVYFSFSDNINYLTYTQILAIQSLETTDHLTCDDPIKELIPLWEPQA